MFQEIISAISGIFKPAAELVDDLHTSEEEKLTLRNELAQIQALIISRLTELIEKKLELESKLIQSQAAIIIAESKSDSWLTRTWRPLGMMILLMLTVFAALGWLTIDSVFQNRIMDIVQWGLVGYVGGRSLEKGISSITSAITAIKR